MEQEFNWRSYNKEFYSGKYGIKNSDFVNAKIFKNSLSENLPYSKIIYSIKENLTASCQVRFTDLKMRLRQIVFKDDRVVPSREFCVVILRSRRPGNAHGAQRLTEALDLIEVRVLDHFIVGDGEPLSMVEHGWM